MIFFNYFIFPGFLFTAVIGMLASWVDRKVTARVQWRQGPPWYQSFADFIKLLGKEVIVPRQNRRLFLVAPLLALASVTVVATLLGRSMLRPQESFLGDLIVVIYLLTIPATALILGASASANPLASVGASREIKLVLSYELPFLLSMAIVILKSGGLIRINDIIRYQMVNGSILSSASGAVAFVAAILCMQAKLGFVPFDMSEAEQEIMAGALIEYSGAPLAIFKLTKQMLLVVLPIFLISLFWANNLSVMWVILKYVILLVIIILIKNTNPRVKIDQATRFFWGPMTVICIIGVILALIGY
ncbi:MAG: NADH-quinone oxidoreductase subunit H [Candidatus Omnitrophica bacterium]|nr:NADH-quinone oxidoreductase subunit H [Candidatus Omnitrophota bacterium]HOX54529.1 NADH-quinone oxidoreductase subunit H [Candidatus Omnitrophota bacterium]